MPTTITSTASALDPFIGGSLEVLSKAYTSHEWAMLAGAVLMLLIGLVRQTRVLSSLPTKLVPWATIGVAVATSFGLGLTQHQSLSTMLATAFSTALVAVGSWEAVGKHLFDIFKKAEPPAAASPTPPAPGG